MTAVFATQIELDGGRVAWIAGTKDHVNGPIEQKCEDDSGPPLGFEN
ncbi:MAG TPA: hypothetical protein VMH05_22710 [Bryobacteraceae bacterium]|nr:hypothetical protein [Bryobacteraceae bacterium]